MLASEAMVTWFDGLPALLPGLVRRRCLAYVDSPLLPVGDGGETGVKRRGWESVEETGETATGAVNLPAMV